MKHARTFVQFLLAGKDSDDIGPTLAKHLDCVRRVPKSGHDNLFVVSQAFMKDADGVDPEQILADLVIAYHRWVAESAEILAKAIERSVAANRVIFIEDGEKPGDLAWRQLNAALLDTAGSIQDLIVASNHQLSETLEKSEEK
jgi:hypothetical protein